MEALTTDLRTKKRYRASLADNMDTFGGFSKNWKSISVVCCLIGPRRADRDPEEWERVLTDDDDESRSIRH